MKPNAFEILRITDGTADASGVPNFVDLLADGSGFCLQEWIPAITEPKGGGVWSDSQMSNGRQMHMRKVQNVSETMTVDIHGWDTDDLAKETQKLRRLLRQAHEFWTTSWSRVPVWIEARAVRETNSRYAIIRNWSTPQDDEHYGDLFWQKVARADMADFDIILEREPYWRDTEPGSSTCLPISGKQLTTQAYSLLFDSDTSEVNLGFPALFQDLPAADFTVEAWVKADGWGTGDLGQMIAEGSWTFGLNSGNGITANTNYTVDDAASQCTTGDFSPDGLWHHVAGVWDQSNDWWTIYVDGVDVTNVQTAGNGVYSNVGALSVAIGNWPGTGDDIAFDGEIGWCRISDNTRYTADFDPPVQCQLPLDDANTLWLGLFWPIYGLTGSYSATVTDESGNGNDGTQVACTWTVACQEYFGNYQPCSPSYMAFNGATSLVNVGSGATIGDLPSGDFTIDAWIRADSYGESNVGRVFHKASGLNGWFFRMSSAEGLYVLACYDVTDAISTSTLSDFSADSEWHHVAAVFDAGTDLFDLYVDGVEVTYTLHQAGANAYAVDAAATAIIGNNLGGTVTFDGDIQWVRLSDNERWTADFDSAVPERCTVPTVDANTVAIWSPTSATLVPDFSWNANTGTGVDVTLGCDCITAAVDETCDAATVFLTNHHKPVGLTRIYHYDDNVATYSPNLLFQALPYPILPNVPAVSDCLYLGIDDLMGGQAYGPFNSAVFNLDPVQTGIVSMDWQYYDTGGSWTSLASITPTLIDNTSITATFDNSGIGSVHWQQPTDWDTVTINGITGYWARAIVTSISGTPTPPAQQDENIYTISWPYIDITEEQIGGDVEGLAREQLNSVGRGFGANRVIAGLRSLSRGDDFTAFLNITDRQWPSWYSVLKAAAISWIDDSTAPTGRAAYWLPGADDEQPLYAVIGSSATQHFYGKFHAFLRASQLNGSAGDMSVQLQVSNGLGDSILYDPVALTDINGVKELLDLGAITLPATEPLYATDAFATYLEITLINTGGAGPSLTVYDIILIPTDEWSIDTSGDVSTGYFDQTAYIDIDSAVQLRRELGSTLWFFSFIGSDSQVERWQATTGGPAILQANADQRLWVLCTEEDEPEPKIAHSAQMWRVQRYYSMRGDR